MSPNIRVIRVVILALTAALGANVWLSLPGNVWAQEPTARPTPTFAPEWTITPTATLTPTITPTPTETGTPTITPTITPTFTATPTITGTATLRPVTPISTLDRWYRGPGQATRTWVGTIDGTPGILPVVGAQETGQPARPMLLLALAGLLLGAFRLLLASRRVQYHG